LLFRLFWGRILQLMLVMVRFMKLFDLKYAVLFLRFKMTLRM